MAHPVVHAEIRSQDPDATRRFFADLFGWKVASEGAFPGYTFIDTGVEGGTFVAISPRQSAEDDGRRPDGSRSAVSVMLRPVADGTGWLARSMTSFDQPTGGRSRFSCSSPRCRRGCAEFSGE